LRIDDTGTHVLIKGLRRPDQVGIAPDGALWITEDRKSGRLLRFAGETLEVVAGGLVKPQGIAFRPGGDVLVSEQGLNRIVRIRRIR